MADIYLLEKACQTDDMQLFLNSFQGNNATFIYEDLNGHCVTPLHTAVKFRAVQICGDLLSRGAAVDIMDDVTGDTPLHVLCKGGQRKGEKQYGDVYQFFGEASAAPSSSDDDIMRMLLARNPGLDQLNSDGELPITISCQSNDVTKVCKLLDHDKKQTILRNESGFTALHEAIVHNGIESVKVLLEYGADVNATCLQEADDVFTEMTPLQLAYKCYSRDIFELVLAKGAKQVELGPKIHLATFLGEDEDVRSLALGESVNVFDAFGRSPLHIACGVKDRRMVETLLGLGAMEKGTVADPDMTPFLVACETGSGEIVGCLLRRGMYTESTLREAMDVTLGQGHVDVLRELVSHGAVGLTDANVDSLLEMACERQNVELAKLILGHCRPKTRLVVDMTTLSNCLCMACEYDNRELVDCLVRYGANVNSRNSKNRYPLHCAMMRGHTELVSQLINLGAKVTAPMGPGYHSGRTALYLLCDRGDIEMATILIRGGASVNIPSDTRLGTPLNVAVYNSNLAIAKLVLEAGACVNARSPRRGWSPINSLLQSWVANFTEGRGTDPESYFATLQLLDGHGVSFNDLSADDLIQEIYVIDRDNCLRLLHMACGRLQRINTSLMTSMLQHFDMEGLATLAAAGYRIEEKINRLSQENPDCPRLGAMAVRVNGAVTLQSLCRFAIRHHCDVMRGLTRQRMHELPLPTRLISYLNMEY